MQRRSSDKIKINGKDIASAIIWEKKTPVWDNNRKKRNAAVQKWTYNFARSRKKKKTGSGSENKKSGGREPAWGKKRAE